jgi:hypothetical protein
MPRKVFTAGEVLAAADVNSFLMDQTVMSFAGTAARGSAIGTATEGMYTHLEDTDALQFWNGSAWVSPFGATLLATSTFTTSASPAIDNVFTSQFENYKIIFDISSSSTGLELRLRLRAGGSPESTSVYENGLIGVGVADSVAFNSTDSASASYFAIGTTSNTNIAAGELNFFSPQLSKRTRATGLVTGKSLNLGGYETTVTTSFDGFEIFPNTGTITGTIRVYGWRNS